MQVQKEWDDANAKALLVANVKASDDMKAVQAEKDAAHKRDIARDASWQKSLKGIQNEIANKKVYADVNCAVPVSGMQLYEATGTNLTTQTPDSGQLSVPAPYK